MICIEVHLDLIDPTEVIDLTSGRGCIIKIRRMAIKAGGNQKTARWRVRRGGAWCQPVNTKFKV
jgi:hypothetical protein